MALWEDMTELEQAEATYSDMHKDAYGFRPRDVTEGWTLEQYEAEFAILEKAIAESIAETREYQQACSEIFEERVLDVIASGAGDRETALRWIMDGSEAGGDWEYFCFLNGLSYGYFRSK